MSFWREFARGFAAEVSGFIPCVSASVCLCSIQIFRASYPRWDYRLISRSISSGIQRKASDSSNSFY
jgi:hypothetical protein